MGARAGNNGQRRAPNERRHRVWAPRPAESIRSWHAGPYLVHAHDDGVHRGTRHGEHAGRGSAQVEVLLKAVGGREGVPHGGGKVMIAPATHGVEAYTRLRCSGAMRLAPREVGGLCAGGRGVNGRC
jgi:hypothetical protein